MSASHSTPQCWELWAPIDVAGPGNNANPSPMRYYTQPVRGEPLRLGFNMPRGVGFYLLGFGPLQRPVFRILAPPLCEQGDLYVNLVSYLVLGSSEPNFAWNVPNSPLIIGATLVFQGASVEPGNCFRVTDALQVRFQ